MWTVLLPPTDVMHGEFSPRMQQRQRRGQRRPFDGWLRTADHPHPLPEANWPVIAGGLLRDEGIRVQPGDRWLRLDPSSATVDINGIRLLAFGEMMRLSADEHLGLRAALQDLVRDAGFELHWSQPERAYLLAGSEAPARVEMIPTAEILGEDLLEYLPGDGRSQDSRRWRLYLTDWQMQLHEHPVNQRRRRNGLPAVNLLWPWEQQQTSLNAVLYEPLPLMSPDADWRAVWTWAGGQAGERPTAAELVAGGVQPGLVDLRDLRRAASLERDWLVPLLEAGSGRLRLVSAEQSIRLGRFDRFKVWR